MDIPPTRVRDNRIGSAEGGDLPLLPPEHVCTVHCDQDRHGPVSGGIAEIGAKDIQAVVRTEQVGCVRDVDGSSRG